MKLSVLLFIVISIFLSCNSTGKKNIVSYDSANKPSIIAFKNGCGYINKIESKDYFLFNSDNEATQAMKSIMKLTGLPANFELKAADVDNAVAVVMRNVEPPKRYVLYNQTFFTDIKKQTGTKYAALSILAHEIGHHLAGHTLSETGSRPLLELEADRFSGYILRKVNASLDQAQAAIKKVCPEKGNETHPGKSARLAAIANGWKDADEQLQGKFSNELTAKNESLGSEILKNDYLIIMPPEWVLAMRNKKLNKNELEIVNSPDTDTRQLLDGETLIATLKSGHEIKLLSSEGKFYKIKTLINGVIKEGFIAKNVNGKPTILKI